MNNTQQLNTTIIRKTDASRNTTPAEPPNKTFFARTPTRRRGRLLPILTLVGVSLGTGMPCLSFGQSPGNPNTNISKSDGYDTVENIEASFNNGRRQEELQLGLDTNAIADLDLPDQATWDALSWAEQGLYLLNEERTSRAGIDYGSGSVLGLPFEGVGVALTTRSQEYAEYLRANGVFGHKEDGGPGDRMDEAVGDSCQQFNTYSENLWAGGVNDISARAVYNWTYRDANSNWGHRKMVLHQSFTDDYGDAGQEGIIGFGVAVTGASTVVLNYFDPTADCSETLLVATSSLPEGEPTSVPVTPTASDASAIGSFSFTANWSTIANANSYRLDVSTDSFATYVVEDLELTDTNYTLDGLDASTGYQYRVRAYNSAGTSVNSNVISVTTTTMPEVVVAACAPEGTLGTGMNYSITKVEFSDSDGKVLLLNEENDKTAAYEDFTGTGSVISAEAGEVLNFLIESPRDDDKPTKIWVDADNDGYFSETDELLINADVGNVSASMTVPSTMSSGYYRLRIRKGRDKQDSCKYAKFSQVEDYVLQVSDASL